MAKIIKLNGKSDKNSLLQEWIDDDSIEEVMLIGKTKDDDWIYGHTVLTSLYEWIGYLMIRINYFTNWYEGLIDD